MPVQIFDVKFERGDHDMDWGTLLRESKSLKVACKGGFIEIIEIKLPGKRKMKVSDLLNGFKLEADAKLL